MRTARATAVIAALLVCAWFALGIRQAHDTARATAIVSQGDTATAAQARQVNSLLNAAGWLNPDEEVQILRGRIALLRGDSGRAQQILAGVTRQEPRNLEAWLWVAHAAGRDRARFYSALAQVRRLEPVIRAAP